MQLMYFLYPDIENSFHIRITNPAHSGLAASKSIYVVFFPHSIPPLITDSLTLLVIEKPLSLKQSQWPSGIFFYFLFSNMQPLPLK
jgi:hypothetical protein